MFFDVVEKRRNPREPKPKVLATVSPERFDSFRMPQKPCIAEITRLGPDLGVIVYNTREKRLALGFFTDPETGAFGRMLNKVDNVWPDKKELKIYLAGVTPEPDEAPAFETTKGVRTATIRQLTAHGYQSSQIEVHWPDSGYWQKVSFNTDTGEFQCLEYQYTLGPDSIDIP